jgi:hypothetical protein
MVTPSLYVHRAAPGGAGPRRFCTTSAAILLIRRIRAADELVLLAKHISLSRWLNPRHTSTFSIGQPIVQMEASARARACRARSFGVHLVQAIPEHPSAALVHAVLQTPYQSRSRNSGTPFRPR